MTLSWVQLVIKEKGQYRAVFAGWDKAQAEFRAQFYGWSPAAIAAGALIHHASAFDSGCPDLGVVGEAQLFATANGLVLPQPVYSLAEPAVGAA